MKKFNPSTTAPDRAVQAWQVLIGAAMNRQTFTYSGLATVMFKREASGVLSGILGRIAKYCDDNDLPQLNTIVVGKDRGTPGVDIPLDRDKIDATREKVYQYDWYDIYVPQAEELKESI